jgi:hypothetical protein
VTRTGILTVIAVALLVAAVTWLVGPWWTLGVVLGVTLTILLLALIAAKTGPGRRAAGAIGRRVAPTRLGRRLTRTQLHAEAKRRGIATTDPFGRPLSDLELQLALVDSPETRAVKRQLKGMNPQQRAQALRLMERQADEVRRTGAPAATPPAVPRQRISGRPPTQPQRSRRRRKR